RQSARSLLRRSDGYKEPFSGRNRSGPVMRPVATALPARDRATIIALDGPGHHAAVAPRADGHAAWTDTDGDVPVAPATVVAIVTVAADPNIDALRHLELLGLGRNGAANQRGRHHSRPGRQGENDLQHVGLLPRVASRHTTGTRTERFHVRLKLTTNGGAASSQLERGDAEHSLETDGTDRSRIHPRGLEDRR